MKKLTLLIEIINILLLISSIIGKNYFILLDWLEPIPGDELHCFCRICKKILLAKRDQLKCHALSTKHIYSSKSWKDQLEDEVKVLLVYQFLLKYI